MAIRERQDADRLEANKALVQRFMELLLDPETADEVRDLLTEDYVQHNPDIPSGVDAIIAFAKSETAVQAKKDMQPSPEPPVLVAEGDLVVKMLTRELADPDDPGATYRGFWFEMWRVEDGRLAEHWDAVPKTPSPS